MKLCTGCGFELGGQLCMDAFLHRRSSQPHSGKSISDEAFDFAFGPEGHRVYTELCDVIRKTSLLMEKAGIAGAEMNATILYLCGVAVNLSSDDSAFENNPALRR